MTLLSGQVVKITMNEREVCHFYCTVILQGVADRLRAVFNQNFHCDSATRSFSFSDNSSFYILSKFGGRSLVLDHQRIPGQHDTGRTKSEANIWSKITHLSFLSSPPFLFRAYSGADLRRDHPEMDEGRR